MAQQSVLSVYFCLIALHCFSISFYMPNSKFTQTISSGHQVAYLPIVLQYTDTGNNGWGIFLQGSLQSIVVFSSIHEWAYAIARRPSSVCPSVNFYTQVATSTTHDSIATKLAHDGPHMVLHLGCAQGQGQGQRSRDTDTFLITRKSLLLTGKWLDRHQTCTWWSPEEPASRACSRSRSRSKVTW